MKHILYILYCTLSLLMCFPLKGEAQGNKGSIYYSKDDGLYWAAIKTTNFSDFIARQRDTNWCWAACTQMVLNYQGVNVTQEEIVERVFGAKENNPAGAKEIVKGASGWYVNGHQINAGYDYPLSPQKLINDLVSKYPLIIGLRMPGQNIGHAYVLTGIGFNKNGDAVYPQKVILRDPWPENESRIILTWSNFSDRVHTIVHVYPN